MAVNTPPDDRSEGTDAAREVLASIGRTHRTIKMPQAIAQELRKMIVRGDLPADSMLPPEAELRVQLGVSRPTLREAMRILESESLLTISRGKGGGARVQMPHVDVAVRYFVLLLMSAGATFDDVYKLRLMIEPPAAARLSRQPASVRAQLREAYEVEAATLDPLSYARGSAAFHTSVVDLVGSGSLSIVAAMLGEVAEGHCLVHTSQQDAALVKTQRQAGLRAHRRLVELVEAGDAERAEDFWRRHMVGAGEVMLEILGKKSLVDML